MRRFEVIRLPYIAGITWIAWAIAIPLIGGVSDPAVRHIYNVTLTCGIVAIFIAAVLAYLDRKRRS